MICGDDSKRHPIYRSSTYLTKFFQDVGIKQVHDGSTRKWWVLSVLQGLNGPDLQKVILRLVSPKLYGGNRDQIRMAITTMNEVIAVESLKVKLEGIEPRLMRETPHFDFTEKATERELKPLPPPDFGQLNLEYGLAEILKQRWDEIQIDKWYEFINEPTTADAILDRLTASAHRIELLGKSLRKKNKSVILNL